MNGKKIILFFILIILVNTMTLSPSASGTKNFIQKNVITYGSILTHDNKVFKNILNKQQSHIDSSPISSFDYGKKMGIKYYNTYHIINTFFSKLNRKVDKKILEQVNAQMNIMNKYCNYFLEELKGLSFSTKIPIKRLLILQYFISYLFSSGKCTITASTYPATKNNQSFLTQNWDISSFSPLLPLTRFYTYFPQINNDENGYRYVFLGIPVIGEIPLMNEKALGFAGAGLSLTKNTSRYIDTGDGIPIYYLELLTMKNCSNITEVVNLWNSVPRSSDPKQIFPNHYDYDITLWGDKEGKILIIEQTHHYFIAVYGNSTEITNAPPGILWHANHHFWLDPNQTGSSFPDETTSGTRTKRARELLETYYGNITLNECMNITRDHGGGTNPKKEDSSDICCRPDIHSSFTTAFSWIVVPKYYTVYWTHARPCKPVRGDFRVHNYTMEFDSQVPCTRLLCNGQSGQNDSNISDIKIEFLALDNLSGIASTYFKINDERWNVYRNQMNVSKNCKYEIQYFSVDKAGNIEETKVSKITFDKSPSDLSSNASAELGDSWSIASKGSYFS
jgi:hypothetical protein